MASELVLFLARRLGATCNKQGRITSHWQSIVVLEYNGTSHRRVQEPRNWIGHIAGHVTIGCDFTVRR